MAVHFGSTFTMAAFGVALTGAALADPDCRFCVFGLNGPEIEGSSMSFEYGLDDQDRNWSGTHSAPAAGNTDKHIRDEYYIAAAGLAVGRDWQMQISAPYIDRLFTTDENGPVETFRHSGFGDVQLTAAYSGLLRNKSLGVMFGIKLPTGDVGYAGFPGDMQIGTGSTDAVLGLTYEDEVDEEWEWSAELLWTKPFAGSHRYKPGTEIGAAFALSYGGLKFDVLRLKPSLQLSATNASKEAGIDADVPNSGGSRIMLSPGLEVAFQRWSLAGEVGFPIYQYMRGNQLVARHEFRLTLSYALDGGDDPT